MGATLEAWPKGMCHPMPMFSTFVLTMASGEKLYGASVVFYEDFDEAKLTNEQRIEFGLAPPPGRGSVPERHVTIHQNKSVCLVSRWPFFDAFKKFLYYLYRLSVSGSQPVPIER